MKKSCFGKLVKPRYILLLWRLCLLILVKSRAKMEPTGREYCSESKLNASTPVTIAITSTFYTTKLQCGTLEQRIILQTPVSLVRPGLCGHRLAHFSAALASEIVPAGKDSLAKAAIVCSFARQNEAQNEPRAPDRCLHNLNLREIVVLSV